jgi:hypothetical protein
MAARDISSSIPSRSAEPEVYEPRNRREAGIIRWLNDHGVSIVFNPPGGLSSATPSTIRLNPEDGTSVLFHEAAHTWLNRFGYSSIYRYQMPEGLQERARALEYRQLDRMIGRIIDLEERLRPDERRTLIAVFGLPESGVAPVSNPRRGSTIAERASIIGNLVDETATLGRPRDVGHPIHGFHEFFASSMATLAFDGERFFRSLQRLERLAEESPRYRRLYETTLELLRKVHELGQSMFQEIRQAQVPDMHRFERNMARLGKFIELETPRQERARL